MIEPPPDDIASDNREPLDTALVSRAENVLRGVARGNGLISGQIRAVRATGEVLNFEGLAFFTVEPKTAEKRVPGKQPGQVLGSAADMRAKIQAATEKAAENPEVRAHTVQVLKKRKDMGVLVNDQYVTLEKLRQAFVVHEGCAPCGRDGKMMCQSCHGKGRTQCKKCFGTKEMQCPLCRGARVVNTPQGQQGCTRCHGRGKLRCAKCQFTGFENCPVCRTTGHTACQNCNGTGWHSLVGTLEIKAKSRFDYDRAGLPADVIAAIDALGPRLVTEGHATAAIIEDEARIKQLAEIGKPGEYVIPYHLRLPAGRIAFAMPRKAEIEAGLFGFVPLLRDVPPFLEEPLAPALTALDAAAAGNAEKLREATRARFAGEVLLTVLRHPRKKALRLLQKRYPVGIGAARLQQAIIAAEKALARIVNRPRMIGFALGTASAAGFFAAYFIGPARGALTALAQQQPATVMIAADGGVLAVGVALSLLAAQYMATGGVRRALGKLAAKMPAAQLAPLSPGLMLAAAGVAGLLFLGTVEAGRALQDRAPPWYEAARGRIIPAAPDTYDGKTGKENAAAGQTE